MSFWQGFVLGWGAATALCVSVNLLCQRYLGGGR